MFDPNFFPTPEPIIYQIIQGLNLKGKIIVEPQGGKADIINVLKKEGAKVLACELNDDLAQITAKACDVFLKQNWFDVTSDEISHCDFIIMNPPFDHADKHILHAYEIAPDGCQIISLCNTQTYYEDYSRERRHLKQIIKDIGTFNDLGDVFSNAERKTGVNVGLINLFKPKSESEDEFDGFLFTEEEEQEFTGNIGGLVKYSKIRDIVGRYIQAVKMFDDVVSSASRINEVMKPLGGDFKVQFNTIEQRGTIYASLNRVDFKSKLQKSSWLRAFSEMKMDKYLTKGIIDKLNKQIETQITKPFTMRNIFNVIEVISGTHGDRMQQVLIDVFDWLTERHHDNRHQLEGWKTNNMYFVGMKFIAPYAGITREYSGGYPEIRWSTHGEKIDELVKALCVLVGKNYDDCITLEQFFKANLVPNDEAKQAIKELGDLLGLNESKGKAIHNMFKYFAESGKINRENVWRLGEWGFTQEQIDKIIVFYQEKMYPESAFGEKYEYKEWGTWYDFNFFSIKVFKKGTLHAKFLDKKVWEEFNKAAVKAKGWQLPTNTGSDVRRKTTGVEVY